MQKETWKDIPGYESLYQASSLGRIRSLDRKLVTKNGSIKIIKGLIKKPSIDKSNRFTIGLSKKGKRKSFTVHKIIALTFIGERPEGYEVCHIDGNSQNNELGNIRYDTHSQNEIDRYRYGDKTPSGKLTIRDVLEVRNLYATGKYSQEELSRKFKVKQKSICYIVNRSSFSWLNDDGSIIDSDTIIS